MSSSSFLHLPFGTLMDVTALPLCLHDGHDSVYVHVVVCVHACVPLCVLRRRTCMFPWYFAVCMLPWYFVVCMFPWYRCLSNQTVRIFIL